MIIVNYGTWGIYTIGAGYLNLTLRRPKLPSLGKGGNHSGENLG